MWAYVRANSIPVRLYLAKVNSEFSSKPYAVYFYIFYSFDFDHNPIPHIDKQKYFFS